MTHHFGSQLRYLRRDFMRFGSLAATGALSTQLFGCKKSRPELPTLSSVPPFQLTDQEGRPFGAEQLRGKTWAAAFMFTRCPSICPRITKTMAELQRKGNADGVGLHWISFSVDPENDTPAVLKAYAAEHGCDLKSWSFLTGPIEQVRDTAENGFKIAFEGKPTEGADHMGISHGSHLVLVDPRLNIRGYYRTLDGDAQERLLADARGLI
jgi:protein SCO1